MDYETANGTESLSMGEQKYLAGSPYWVEHVLGLDLCSRAKDGMLTHLLLNQPPVCDSHCRRCFMPSARRNSCGGQMCLSEARRIIKEASEAGMFCLEISGEGEPLLASSLRGIVQAAFDNGFTTTLITNGHALTDSLVRFFFERKVTLVVSLFSIQRELYELDNGLPNSHKRTIENIRMAADIYRSGQIFEDGKRVFRMAIHATAQTDNISDLANIEAFCDEEGMFFSVAPLAAVGGGAQHAELLVSADAMKQAGELGHNSIILSSTSRRQVGREVCGTCLYGLNVGFDGNVLFDAHSGYEVSGLLGNVRMDSIETLVERQRWFAPMLFQNVTGFCPVRDPFWPQFLSRFCANPAAFLGASVEHADARIVPSFASDRRIPMAR